MYKLFGKWLFDLLMALVALLCLSPVLLVVSLLIRIKLGSPIFFKQERPGKGGKPFHIIKFRTMTDERDEDGDLLPDAVRLTSFGKFLRSTSLDELPELINVLRGEMSLVGPRPLLMQYLELYTPEQARRHDVRPGITGWAQINGRNSLSWEERLNLDLYYIQHGSFIFDLKILCMTIFVTIGKKGMSEVPNNMLRDTIPQRKIEMEDK